MQSPVASSLLDPIIFLSTLFSNTLGLRCPLMWETKFLNPGDNVSKIVFFLNILIRALLCTILEDNILNWVLASFRRN
jgi:hypothetical protein